MKPIIYVTRRLPEEIAVKLREDFQVLIWQEEDFGYLEQAIENAEWNCQETASVVEG